MQWLNEPRQWRVEGQRITVKSDPRTDFWRKTHNALVQDNGHFYYQEVRGDFIIEVKLSGEFTDLYDQAGLMVRLDAETWIKCGIEFVNGVHLLSAVITREWSDWSVQPLDEPGYVWLRLTRHAGTLEAAYSLDSQNYSLYRQGFLSEAPTLQAGILIASPTGQGFTVSFEALSIKSGILNYG
jgi:regulation of enolase protein 1 (concanavalin A-like superfamily)